MREELIYDIMVDVDERPKGWNKELYHKLSSDFLIKCAKKGNIEKWNLAYEAYLKSEWKRLAFFGEYDKENNGKLFAYRSGFKRPVFNTHDFKKAIQKGADFSEADLEGADFSGAHLNGADFSEANLEGADFSRAHLKGVNFRDAHLKGVNFRDAHLEGADLGEVDLKEANLWDAHFEGADFWEAHLEGADFNGAHLEDVCFLDAHLEGAKFIQVVVNGGTLFTSNTIDKKTDFIGTSLSAARIDPKLRTQLERNIRQIRWEEWYKKPKLYPALLNIPKTLWDLCCRTRHILTDPPKNKYDPKDYPSLENSIFYLTLRKFLSWPTKPPVTTESPSDQDLNEIEDEKKKWNMKRGLIDRIINAFLRLFWWISNYGSSTKRIIAVFFGWNILWACIYFYVLPFISGLFSAGITTTVLNVSNIGAAILQTNLMMFSITDTATEMLDFFPMLCVTIHIVVGYFILAALITRLGIMFQNLSP